mmetsp:Transcript_18264/g.35738  ORF Transcript_18264/g.35738 Transcript_18264/m.35738 type:complete len:439 (+) Transcript_18264:53-1369(+)|eukprot:CAMPEP_0175131630 /NCGR_PEP_ID=MMETSP0087-20121206/6648_1 /TAXON_ID=136419 /ORGANISM="Unknown Unknown, Strain D1" /LENGTH=438 /DNA_ID=CAMNT_0016413939 /DNA_START=50 /DNA_END=1366 /DNA_ORIENTATION=+
MALSITADSPLADLRAFIDKHDLQVSKGTGGVSKRTKQDIFHDIRAAMGKSGGGPPKPAPKKPPRPSKPEVLPEFTNMSLGPSCISVRGQKAFDNALEAAGAKLVVVDFFATWCGPCQDIAPVFEKLSCKFPGCIFLKVDVDDSHNRCLVADFDISSMPTFVFLRRNVMLETFEGADEKKLLKAIQKHEKNKCQLPPSRQEKKEERVYPPCKTVGRALILSMWDKRRHSDPMHDAEVEMNKAVELVRVLGYKHTAIVDPSKEQALAALRDLRDKSKDAGSVMVCIMAHGRREEVSFKGGSRVALPTISSMLSPENAPDLKGKPKIFLVQACKGGASPLIHDATEDDSKWEPVLSDHDYCWNYATTPGKLATRGLMFDALLDIAKKAPRKNGVANITITDLLTEANGKIADNPICRDNPGSTMMKTTLRGNFAFSALVG